MTDDIAMGIGLAAALYEAVAIYARRVPTITNLTLRLPKAVRALLLLVAAAWAVAHFEILEVM